MGKANDHDRKLIVKILWAGSDLGQSVRRLDRVRSIRAGRGFMADIRSAVWPLLDDLILMEREQGRLYLNPDLPWDGVIANGGDVTTFDSSKRNKKTVEITRQTTASLRIDDLSIVIRVGTLFSSEKDETKLAPQYRGSPLQFICDKPAEWASLAGASIAALILTSSFVIGLKNRDVSMDNTSAAIPAKMLIPFIAPHHFETAPSIIQDRLDRFNFVKSVTGYYREFADMLMNEPNSSEPSYLFSESRNAYERSFSAQKSSIDQLTEAQRVLISETHHRHGRSISLPVALGESAEGSLQRILDKAALVGTSALDVTKTRHDVTEVFLKDPSYDHGASADEGVGKRAYDKKIQELGAGYRGSLPEEDLQATEAHRYAVDATNAQLALFKEGGLISGSIGCCKPIVAIKAGSSPVQWQGSSLGDESDISLASLKASTWGVPVDEPKKEHITEPMAGVVDQKAVERTIAGGKFQLQLCFEMALRRNQTAQGSMEWKWQLDTRGQISSLSLVKSSIRDDELTHCVRGKIAQWKFPKSRGGRVEIRYPFEFIRDKG